MGKYRVTSPEGSVFEVNAPDGASEAEVMAYAKSEFAKQAPTLTKPAAVQAGEAMKGVPRQLGLTARYGLEGVAQAGEIVTEPIRQNITDPLLRYFTGKPGQSATLGSSASSLADKLGLPKPEGANERVIGDATKLLAGAGGLGAAGRVASAAPGLAGQAGAFFAANPTQQLLSAGGAGLAGGSAREAGAGPGVQAGAALLGGVAAPMAANGVMSAGRTLKNALTPAMTTQAVDQQIQLVMQRQGVDWAQVPERVRQGMRQEVAQAMQTGQDLNPDAVRRMLDFARTGATPTRGMLTQDPVQITREMNLAKTGANSSDSVLQSLPRVQGRNTERLLSGLDELGANRAPDAFRTGELTLGALNRDIGASQANINSLYSRARDTAGRSAELDGATFTTQANQALDQGLLGGALPESVASHMNRIARGEVPFTVDYAEQLKTAMGKLQRNTSDGQQRMALGLVRQALENTPLRSAPKVNPGNLPTVPGTVPPSGATLGAESIDAFNAARSANRQFMGRVERTPALQAAMDGAQPDQFVKQFITGQGASVADVNALRRSVANDPEALQAVKSNLALHLRQAATNGTDDVNKFSPASFNRALNNIGDRKLAAFFEPQEIEQLRAIGRVGTLMNSQPAGSAVNNSNSGAMLTARAMDFLDRISGLVPLGGNTMIQGAVRGLQQRKAMNVPQSLLQQQLSPTPMQLLGPSAVYGGLLASQPVNQP